MYLQKKSDWESFHRVYFLAEDSVELNIYTILYTRKTKQEWNICTKGSSGLSWN